MKLNLLKLFLINKLDLIVIMHQAFPNQILFGLLVVPNYRSKYAKKNFPDSSNLTLLKLSVFYRFWWYSWSLRLFLYSLTHPIGCFHPIGCVNEYPTMHYFGNSRHSLNDSTLILTEYLWKFQ